MKHLHTLRVAFGFKSAQTACGKRVKASELAITEDADCPACRRDAEEMHASALMVIESFVKAHGETDHTKSMRERCKSGPSYRNALGPFA